MIFLNFKYDVRKVFSCFKEIYLIASKQWIFRWHKVCKTFNHEKNPQII